MFPFSPMEALMNPLFRGMRAACTFAFRACFGRPVIRALLLEPDTDLEHYLFCRELRCPGRSRR